MDILSCNTFLPFWISWKDNYLRVGTGVVLESDIILSYNDTNPIPIGGIGFATFDVDGITWYFTHFTGTYSLN